MRLPPSARQETHLSGSGLQPLLSSEMRRTIQDFNQFCDVLGYTRKYALRLQDWWRRQKRRALHRGSMDHPESMGSGYCGDTPVRSQLFRALRSLNQLSRPGPLWEVGSGCRRDRNQAFDGGREPRLFLWLIDGIPPYGRSTSFNQGNQA